MPSLIKNSFYSFLIASCLSACNSKTVIVEEECQVISDSDSLNPAKKHTILLSGMIPPPMYSNAQDIVGKNYNINFVYAGGCIVNERLGDSISKFNTQSFAALKKRFSKDVSSEIFAQLDNETAFLTLLDNSIRKDADLKKAYPIADELIYYSKKDKNYIAHVIITEADYKVLIFKLKLLVVVDSLSKNISTILKKDSIINQPSDLQL
ncbi:MAG: hypothetical protein H0W73_05885 [Bacteroidetes bacterium]|nr:hypothetical protein [Bacteroidota bacterium]